MSDNTNLISAIKDAENALTKALNTFKEIASQTQTSPKAEPIALTCSCKICEQTRSIKASFQALSDTSPVYTFARNEEIVLKKHDGMLGTYYTDAKGNRYERVNPLF